MTSTFGTSHLPLPTIVGFGGFNCAGRSSNHQSYLRTIYPSLNNSLKIEVLISLATLMKIITVENNKIIDLSSHLEITEETLKKTYEDQILNGTLIRGIELFDPEQIGAKSAGQLPTGFNPSDHYDARFHPRGLQLSILAASDALHSTGISLETLRSLVQADKLGVYASSALGQIDEYSFSGMTQARLKGKRVSAKQLPLGMNSMPTDFVNAYVLGNLGTTMTSSGACASFLYNLKTACQDIQSGRCKLAIVGNSEAPVSQEVMEGFLAMSALATHNNLKKIDKFSELSEDEFHRTSSRPFSQNAGFVISESAQYIVLMSDQLAIESGADIYGSVPEVFTNADGFKKSISSPGAGNYITMAKAVAYTQQMLGKDIVQKQSFVQSHGSSTPVNRVTESLILNKIAAAFDIKDWPVTAIKSYLGHPLGPASGDQLINSLGCFEYGVIPSIQNVDQTADDIHQSHLNILTQPLESDQPMHVSFLNSKGFGGNNATGILISKDKTLDFIRSRYAEQEWKSYRAKNSEVQSASSDYFHQAQHGKLDTIYNFGKDIIDENDINISQDSLRIDEKNGQISLNDICPY